MFIIKDLKNEINHKCHLHPLFYKLNSELKNDIDDIKIQIRVDMLPGFFRFNSSLRTTDNTFTVIKKISRFFKETDTVVLVYCQKISVYFHRF